MIALDEMGVKPGTGSARSIPGFDVCRALTACSRHLLTHGGHAAAAGLKIEEQNVEAFRAEFCEHAAEQITSRAAGRRAGDRRRGVSFGIDAGDRRADRTPGAVWPVEPAPDAVRHERHAGRAAQAHGRRRAAPVAEAGPAQDQPARRGLWRRRMGRRDRPMPGAAVDRLSPGDQRIPRPPHRRIARGRLALAARQEAATPLAS